MGRGRQKSTRNPNRQGGTSARPDGRVDAYITLDTPFGPRRLKTTKPDQEHADAWLLEVRWLASQGAFSTYDSESITVAEFVGRWLEDEVRPTVRAVTLVNYEKSYRLRISPAPFGRAARLATGTAATSPGHCSSPVATTRRFPTGAMPSTTGGSRSRSAPA
jgi:hypothetical protein